VYLKRIRKITALARKMMAEGSQHKTHEPFPNLPGTRPIENAVTILNSLKHSTASVAIKKNVDYVLSILARDDLFAVDEDAFKPLDEDTKNWVVNNVLQSNHKSKEVKRKHHRASIDVSHIRAEVFSLFKRAATQHAIDFNLQEVGLRRVASVLEHVDSWQFDVFELFEATGGRPLTFLLFFLLEKRKLTDVFKIDRSKLIKFCSAVEKNYHRHPYHNVQHAADVVRLKSLL
jgi:hypothetical protein